MAKEPKQLGERIKYIKRLLGMPFHLFYYTPLGRAILRVEGPKGNNLFWEGPYMAAAVESAMEYVRHELEMGAIVDPKEEKKEPVKEDKNPT